MPRPLKQTVDYFPHYATHGKTLLILENEFGNEGYSFWFKLLELLCVTDNQVYDYNNPVAWRFLLAKTMVNEDKASGILTTLAELGAIDIELHQQKVIWSQNLVDNLDLVYNRRSTGKPEKPIIVNNNGTITIVYADNNSVNDSKKPHTKQDNTKQDNTKQDNTKQESISQLIIIFETIVKKPLTPTDYEILKDIDDNYSVDDFQEACNIAVSKGKFNLRYIDGILRNKFLENNPPDVDPNPDNIPIE